MVSFQFLKFDGVCSTIAISLCPILDKYDGTEPSCYSRNAELGGTLIFQPATVIMQIIALMMTSVMIYHIKMKYTAVGRKEIVMFFYAFMGTTFLDMLLVSGIVPSASSVYPYFAAMQVSCMTMTCWILLLNGFVGFQFAEDGTAWSVWSIRISASVVWIICFVFSMLTLLGIGSFNLANPTLLWIIYFIVNGITLAIYIVSQIILVVGTLDDLWPVGDILFGLGFFLIGQVVMYVFSTDICDAAGHYIDGMFFGSSCTLLAVMMVYKYWDSITKEDLEFAVTAKGNSYEVREMIVDDEHSVVGRGSGYLHADRIEGGY
ncbi:hypothetical protein BZG36_04636 [Bifiguratus adelaidae]|uniref:Chitin synthase export chaperone n=1 Tax=Bifiguratus adelaidae TaxID=1938954 RepID=A0A261XV11_9FUNG|nr:hypothetical protein BZG36_04636 [Bifiguratus adelaidae]